MAVDRFMYEYNWREEKKNATLKSLYTERTKKKKILDKDLRGTIVIQYRYDCT